jgi:methyl-accepting chemotaxis protein
MKVERKAKQDSDDARRELAAGFERKVGSIVEAVAITATKMQGLSSTMSGSNAETTRQTAAAATASNQASPMSRPSHPRRKNSPRRSTALPSK